MKYFTYKLISDTGFAPNPFFNYLSLATCKAKIREYAEIENFDRNNYLNTDEEYRPIPRDEYEMECFGKSEHCENIN